MIVDAIPVQVCVCENATVKLAIEPIAPDVTAETKAYPSPELVNVNADMGNTIPTTSGPTVTVPLAKNVAVVVPEPVGLVTPVSVAVPVELGGLLCPGEGKVTLTVVGVGAFPPHDTMFREYGAPKKLNRFVPALNPVCVDD